MKRTVYADNAATTALDKRALAAMMPYLTGEYGNPNSPHTFGQRMRDVVENSRADIAGALGAQPKEIYFTGSGSESDNWIIKGVAQRMRNKGKPAHIISTQFEHHAILHALEKSGAAVTLLPVHEDGIVRAEDLEQAITDDTCLITVMLANNEIGTLQPIKDLAAVAKSHGILFHTDAVQAVGHIPVDVKDLGVDALSWSGHKFGGPGGIGGLYLKSGTLLENLIDGGGQERGKRAGTEYTAGIVGAAAALTLAQAEMAQTTEKVLALRERLIDGLLEIPKARLNGHRSQRLPGNVNVSIPFIEGESMLLWLDIEGICASSGSACTSGSLDPSHVLLAIGLTHEVAHGSLRFTLSHENTDEDIDYILEKLPPIVDKLRAMSPIWQAHE